MSDDGSTGDMDISDDDLVHDEDEDAEGEEDEEVNVDMEDDDEADQVDEVEDEPTPEVEPPKAAPSKLKIKLKLPSRTTPIETPTPPEVEIESEEELYDEDSDETPGPSTRPLTARQAVKRGVVDSSHVSLDIDPTMSRKKKQLNETELALKREETARKRKNLSEKKLEDEKTETINRLLRKQSRARGKRNALATADDAEAEQEEAVEEAPPETPVPTMYRWVSTSRPPASRTPSANPNPDGEASGPIPLEPDQTSEEKRLRLSFSVPLCAFPVPPAQKSQVGGDAMDVVPPTVKAHAAPQPLTCAVSGCGAPRKYRLVRDWTKGACGMGHLKQLEAETDSSIRIS